MASRTVSPGGALLRASRMFSIPPPLPRPSMDSDSATLPHPTHLSITTPYASLQRGDWGFKRPLPLRSTTKTSTPLIRVEAVDTLEHITEFRSSADHALTLQKWQELDVPLTVTPMEKTSGVANPWDDTNLKSVFENDIDTTTDVAKGVDKFNTRWRFKGPWLAGQNNGEFAEYLKKDIRTKKIEFRDFLREQLAAAMTKEGKEAARNATGGDETSPVIKAQDITEDQLVAYIKQLRKDVKGLYTEIRNFLDLAPVSGNGDKSIEKALEDFVETLSTKAGPSTSSSFMNELVNLPATSSPYASGGPPKTHPSAGLSYSRTASRTFNHPEFGPQEHKSPVEARIVMPKARNRQVPVLGVGGFVTSIPYGDTTFQTNQFNKAKGQMPSIPGLVGIEPDKVGGSKTWVHPKSASIDAEGRVVMLVTHGAEEAVAVKTGTTDLISRTPPSRHQVAAGGYKVSGYERPGRKADETRKSAMSYGLDFGMLGGQRSRNARKSDPGSELAELLGDGK